LSEGCPHTIALSRQSIPNCNGTSFDGAKHGAYVVHAPSPTLAMDRGHPDAIVIATGSELSLAQRAVQVVRDTTGKSVRLVSMPCWEVFEQQSEEYKQDVFPRIFERHRTLSVEAGSSFGWARYADHSVSVDTFGCSAGGSVVLSHFGFTVENVVSKVLFMLS
jgi:transketolase